MHRDGRRWISRWWIGLIVLGVLAALVMIVSGGWLSPWAKKKVISALQKQYQSDLEIQSLDLSLFPFPHASGDGLVFRKKDDKDAPPLIKLQHFEASAGW